MNDLVVVLLIFGNLIWSVYFRKNEINIGQAMRDSTISRRSSFPMPEQQVSNPRYQKSNLTFAEAIEEVRAEEEADENGDDDDETSE